MVYDRTIAALANAGSKIIAMDGGHSKKKDLDLSVWLKNDHFLFGSISFKVIVIYLCQLLRTNKNFFLFLLQKSRKLHREKKAEERKNIFSRFFAKSLETWSLLLDEIPSSWPSPKKIRRKGRRKTWKVSPPDPWIGDNVKLHKQIELNFLYHLDQAFAALHLRSPLLCTRWVQSL